MNDPDSSNGTYGYIAKSEGGQAMMDYLIVCAALAFALLYPIKDDPASSDKARTAAQIVLDSFRLAYQNISHAISLPG